MGELESSSRKRLTLLIDCSRQLFVLYATFISRYVVSRRSKSPLFPGFDSPSLSCELLAFSELCLVMLMHFL